MSLQKQLSSPTISHDDEDQQSDTEAVNKEEKEKKNDEGTEDEAVDEIAKDEKQVEVAYPLQVFYGKRDILDLSENITGLKHFVQYTILPDNNVNCFFQNRAQYWRLSSGEREEHSLEKCPCCDFTYPSTQPRLEQAPGENDKNVKANAITDSLLTFLKNNEQTNTMPITHNKRVTSGTPFGYQMQQQLSNPQQYQPQSNGFYGNNSNSYNGNFNQPMIPFTNNNSGYGTTLALLNLMNNASRNATNAFQAMSCNSINNPRYLNNNVNNGLYKQF